MGKLNLDQEKITQGRRLAASIVEQVRQHIDTHTTVSVERAVLRLLGIDGVDEAGVPLVNVVVEGLQREGVLDQGAKAISAIASVIEAKEEAEVQRIIDQIPDSLRSFNRFGIPASLITRKVL